MGNPLSFPTHTDNASGSVTANGVQSSPGNPLTLNGITGVTVQVNTTTVLTAAADRLTSTEPIIAPSVGTTFADQHPFPAGTGELVAEDSTLLVQPLLLAMTDHVSAWLATQVVGPAAIVLGSQLVDTLPAIVPYDCYLEGVLVQAGTGPPVPAVLTVQRSAKGAPSYSNLAAAITLAMGALDGEWTGSISLDKGDQLQMLSDISWVGGRANITAKIRAR